MTALWVRTVEVLGSTTTIETVHQEATFPATIGSLPDGAFTLAATPVSGCHHDRPSLSLTAVSVTSGGGIPTLDMAIFTTIGDRLPGSRASIVA